MRNETKSVITAGVLTVAAMMIMTGIIIEIVLIWNM